MVFVSSARSWLKCCVEKEPKSASGVSRKDATSISNDFCGQPRTVNLSHLSPVTEAQSQMASWQEKTQFTYIKLHFPTFHKTLQNLEQKEKHWVQIFKTICISLNKRNSL